MDTVMTRSYPLHRRNWWIRADELLRGNEERRVEEG